MNARKNRIMDCRTGVRRAAVGISLSLLAGMACGAFIVDLELQKSRDLVNWETVPMTPELMTEEGRLRLSTESPEPLFFRLRIEAGEAPSDKMVLVEGGTLPPVSDLGALAVDSFLIGRWEVTWKEWVAVREWADGHGYDIGGAGQGCADDHPVHSVSWFDAVKWCNAKSEMEEHDPVYTVAGETYRSGRAVPVFNRSADGYRLPTEEEWEFAARGGRQSQGYVFSGSDVLAEVAWHWANAGGAECDYWGTRGTWPVGQKQANELGLYDMSGNVWEWCWDQDNDRRRLRGGSWGFDGTEGCAVSRRHSYHPDNFFNDYGIRLARNHPAN